MNKFVNFDAAVKAAFDNDESMYMDFSKLMNDVMHNDLDGITVKQANDKIVEMFHKVLGTNSASSKKEIRNAIRRNQIALYEIIEEIVDNALVSGWEQNPFFKEYVEIRNLALGDRNEFYIEDDSVLSVMKVSGNHHDIIRQRLGAGKTFSVETSWIAVKLLAALQ